MPMAKFHKSGKLRNKKRFLIAVKNKFTFCDICKVIHEKGCYNNPYQKNYDG